jgi:hypothetical protein
VSWPSFTAVVVVKPYLSHNATLCGLQACVAVHRELSCLCQSGTVHTPADLYRSLSCSQRTLLEPAYRGMCGRRQCRRQERRRRERRAESTRRHGVVWPVLSQCSENARDCEADPIVATAQLGQPVARAICDQRRDSTIDHCRAKPPEVQRRGDVHVTKSSSPAAMGRVALVTVWQSAMVVWAAFRRASVART